MIVSIVAALLVVAAFTRAVLLRRDMGEPVTDAQVSSSSAVGGYYRADLEALYLHEVRVAGDPALAAAGDDALLARGRSICSALDTGTPMPEGGTALEVDVAAAALCPQHAGIASS